MGFRVDVQMRLDNLDKSIRAVSAATGKSLGEAIKFAAYEFALQSGKAMPPAKGRLGIPRNDRVRRTWTEESKYFPKGESVRGQINVVYFNRDGRTGRKGFYRQKSKARQRRVIKNRGLGKQQFWRAMELIDPLKGSPKTAWSQPGAKANAASRVQVGKGRDIFSPFYRVISYVQSAEGYRPYAQIIGLKAAAFRLRSMARRISTQQQKAWK